MRSWVVLAACVVTSALTSPTPDAVLDLAGAPGEPTDGGTTGGNDLGVSPPKFVSGRTFRRRSSTKEGRVKPFAPTGRYFSRRRADIDYSRLQSGEPDAWFANILEKEPEDLTLDEVEDMTRVERSDYVSQFNFDHARFTSNVVRHLLRLEQLGRVYDRLRPGEDDVDEPFHDHPDATFASEARKQHLGIGADGEVDPNDLRMSSPRWHLDGERERIEADPVWTRMTERKRPPPQPKVISFARVEEVSSDNGGDNDTSSNGGRSKSVKRRIVVSQPDDEKVRRMRNTPVVTTSTVRRIAINHRTTREERARRAAELRLLPPDQQFEAHLKEDPGRCQQAASVFCQGMMYHYAEFIDCVLAKLDRFEDHDDYCRHEMPWFYGPCRADMLKHCPHRDSKEVVLCMQQLGLAEVDAMATSPSERHYTGLSDECLASEHMESMLNSDLGRTMTDAQRRAIYKWQAFWLSQHDDPKRQGDALTNPADLTDSLEVVMEEDEDDDVDDL
jgi:hypothetical protein